MTLFACQNCRVRSDSVRRHLLPSTSHNGASVFAALCLDCFASRVRGARDPLVSPCVVCHTVRKWMFAGPRMLTKCARAEPDSAFRCVNHVINEDVCDVAGATATIAPAVHAPVRPIAVPAPVAVAGLVVQPMPKHWD